MIVYLLTSTSSRTVGHGESAEETTLCSEGYTNRLYPAFSSREAALQYIKQNDLYCNEVTELEVLELAHA